jgi:serine phosphatase RsbU (regulator of sigma subunit)/anti-sigma regulatory factor (Ser/Thr protein kinase)
MSSLPIYPPRDPRLRRSYGQGRLMALADTGEARRSPLAVLRDVARDLDEAVDVRVGLARVLRRLVLETGAAGGMVLADEEAFPDLEWWRPAAARQPRPTDLSVTARPRWPSADAGGDWAVVAFEVAGRAARLCLAFPDGVPDDRSRRLVTVSLEALRLVGTGITDEAPRRSVTPQSPAVGVTGGSDDVLARTIDLIVPRLADGALLYLLQGHELRRVEVRHIDEDRQVRLGRLTAAEPLDSGAPTRVAASVRERRSEIIDGDELRLGSVDPALASSRADAVMIIPLVVDADAVGAAVLLSDDPDGFTLRDLELAELVCSSAASALQAVGAYSQARAAAEALRRAGLPESLPSVEGYEIAGLYLPVAEHMDVGGDWYDAFFLEDSRVAFAVGDVVGHGLGAATAMSQLRNSLRAYVREDHDVATALGLLNRLMNTSQEGDLAAALVGVLDPVTGVVEYARAGHLPPVVARAAGTWEIVEADDPRASGPLLGAFEGATYESHRVRLEPGDVLLGFTDGMVERRDRGLDKGIRWLAGHAVARPGGPPDGLCDLLAEELLREGGQRDDACLIAIERAPVVEDELVTSVPADIAALSDARRRVRDWLEARAVEDRTLDDTELVLAELLANAVEASPDDGVIELRVGIASDRVAVDVTDHGTGFTLPPEEVVPDPLAPRGRGLRIVRAAAVRVDVQHGRDGTRVRAVLRRMATVDAES